MSAAPLAADLAGRLKSSIDLAQATLGAAFAGPALDSILAESFGRDVADAAAFQMAVKQLRNAWQRGDLVIDVELRSAAELNGHPAAYTADGVDGTERIYVNRDWLLAVDDTSQVAGALLEEFGQAVRRSRSSTSAGSSPVPRRMPPQGTAWANWLWPAAPA